MLHETTIRPGSGIESIDFNKLRIVLRNNWAWLVTIFVLVNGLTFLYLRYTKNVYESSSELKLEVKNDASELGIKNVIEESNVSLLSGEIELIQSKLFLGLVLEKIGIDVAYNSVGRVTNLELFGRAPFSVKYKSIRPSHLNVPIYFEELNTKEFRLRLQEGTEVTGHYGKPLTFANIELVLTRDGTFRGGDELGYYFVIQSKDAQLQYLSKNLTAEPLNFNASTIRISFKDYNPSKAQFILNKIDTLYLVYSNEQKNLANRQKIDWLSNELAQIEKKMEAYETYFENFTLENRTNNLDEDLKRMITHINEIDSQRYSLSQRISRLNKLSDDIAKNNFLTGFSQRHNLPDGLHKSLDDLNRLILEQEKLRMSYNEITFAFRERQKEIENLKTKTVGQIEEIRKEASAHLEHLNKRKRSLEQEFAGIPDKNTQFSKNLRFYKLNEQLYLTLMQSKSEFEVVQAGTVPDFRILSPASFPTTPISPRRMMISAAGLVASITLMILFLGIKYLLNNKITSLQEVESQLKLPLMGVIPVSKGIKSPGLFIMDQPRSMVSEAFRTIRTNLDFFHAESQKKIISISSTVSGEGKSFVATNLGAMIALSGKKVILLDLDMRKAKSNLQTHIEDPTRGISTILSRKNHWPECVVNTTIAGYDFIPSGPHPPNPAELLLGESFGDLVRSLRDVYDYVIMDTPPVGLVADGIMAMKKSDLSIYIFRANYSKKDFMQNLQRIMAINKFSNISMILNALPSSGAHKYGYGYYQEDELNRKWTQLFNT